MAKAAHSGSLTVHYTEGKQDGFSILGNGSVLRGENVHWFFTERNLFDVLKELH